MSTRNLDKELLKSSRTFSTTVKLCEDAVNQAKISRYKGLLSSLETVYTKLDEDFALYKDDLIKKVCKTEAAFNSDVDEYSNNDQWSEKQFEK